MIKPFPAQNWHLVMLFWRVTMSVSGFQSSAVLKVETFTHLGLSATQRCQTHRSHSTKPTPVPSSPHPSGVDMSITNHLVRRQLKEERVHLTHQDNTKTEALTSTSPRTSLFKEEMRWNRSFTQVTLQHLFRPQFTLQNEEEEMEKKCVVLFFLLLFLNLFSYTDT